MTGRDPDLFLMTMVGQWFFFSINPYLCRCCFSGKEKTLKL